MHTSNVGHITTCFGASYTAYLLMLVAAICYKDTSCKQLMLVVNTAAAGLQQGQALTTMHTQTPYSALQTHNTAVH